MPLPPPSCSSLTSVRPVTSRSPSLSSTAIGRITATVDSNTSRPGVPVEQNSLQSFQESVGRPPAPSPPDSVGEHQYYDQDREEGYDYDFVPPTDNKYECPICLLVLRGTVQTSCGHRFCTACIHRWMQDMGGPKCPVCNEAIAENHLFPDKFADREIMSFKVRCPQNKYGCKIITELKHLDAHTLDTCEFRFVPCPNHCTSVIFKKDIEWHRNKECTKREIVCDLCGVKVLTSEKHKHKAECLEENVDCQYCKTAIKRKQLKFHKEKCDMVPIKCVFHPIGCQTEIVRSKLNEHNETQTQFHLNLTARALNSILQLQAAYIYNRQSPLNSVSLSQTNNTNNQLTPSNTQSTTQGTPTTRSADVTDGNSSNINVPQNTPNLNLRQNDVPPTVVLTSATSNNKVIGGGNTENVAGPKTPGEISGGVSDGFLSEGDRLTNFSTTPLMTNFTTPGSLPGSPAIFSDQFGAYGDGPNRPYVNMPSFDQKNIKPSLRQISCEESLRLAGEGGVDIVEKSKQQEAAVARQKQLILELQAKVASLESRLGEQSHTVKTLKEKAIKQEDIISNLEGRNCNGVYIWKIREFQRFRQEAIRGATNVLHSPGFYTSFYGYKLCVRANLNGVEGGNGSHISIFIHFMRGENDDILEWPFRGKIVLSIIDQGEHKQHVTEVLESKPTLAAFQKPLSNRNHKGFGYIEFAPVGMIERSSYVSNDTLIIKAEVSESPCS